MLNRYIVWETISSSELSLPRKMTLVFHVSQLEPIVPNINPNMVQSPPPPVEVDREPEYEISEILDSKVDCWQRNCKLLYLVHWSGYERCWWQDVLAPGHRAWTCLQTRSWLSSPISGQVQTSLCGLTTFKKKVNSLTIYLYSSSSSSSSPPLPPRIPLSLFTQD